MADQKHVVIAGGGGFAGLNVMSRLRNKEDIKVTLIDRRNHHLFQPLLYQVAMAALSPADIATPIRSITSDSKNIDVLLGLVVDVDLKQQVVKCDFGDVSYDYLVIAMGATHSYFGNDQWEEHAPGLKSLEEATEIRKRMLISYELAERETNPEIKKELLTFVIIGGGPTGVELAGALGEISRYTLSKDFRNIDPKRTRIILIEGASRILGGFSPEMSAHASRELEKLGVTIWTNSMVTDVNEHGVVAGDERIRAHTVLWAAGVRPSEINYRLGLERDRAGRIIVNADLSLPGYENVFAIGDLANFSHTADGKPLPGLAPIAMQQGRTTGSNILADLKGKKRKTFKYRDKGMMATIGKASAVMEVGKWKQGGFLAWMAWLFVHIYYLIGFRNRMMVLMQWAWSYITVRRGARLITSKIWKTRQLEDIVKAGGDRRKTPREENSKTANKTKKSSKKSGKKSVRKSSKKTISEKTKKKM